MCAKVLLFFQFLWIIRVFLYLCTSKRPRVEFWWQRMTNISLRIYGLICLLFTGLGLWAQRDDMLETSQKAQDGFSSMDEFVDYQPFHITILDVVMVVLVLAACYVFGKIWKGCTYMILVLAALFYYMLR